MNKAPRIVRKKAEDPRVLRTRLVLGTALVDLMLARRFDDISVQQVLDRAQVGRAPFYAAAALVEMMRWWLDRGTRPDATEMDVQFHEIL